MVQAVQASLLHSNSTDVWPTGPGASGRKCRYLEESITRSDHSIREVFTRLPVRMRTNRFVCKFWPKLEKKMACALAVVLSFGEHP